MLKSTVALLLAAPLLAAAAPDQSAIRRDRINTLLPDAMKSQGIEMWLTFTRENAQDPLLPTLGLEHIVARGAFIFTRTPEGAFHKIAIAASYDVDPIQKSGLYDEVIAYKKEGVRPHLVKAVTAANPKTIAVNFSRDETVADGLTLGMRNYLEEALGPDMTRRFVSSDKLVVSLMGRKLPAEIALLRQAAELTQKVLAEALTPAHVIPGKTTEISLNAWMEEQVKKQGCEVAFASVVAGPARGHSDPTDRVIQRGDVLRTDWGASCGGYAADIQRTAYVLKAGETRAPGWLEKLWQDNVAANRAAMAACKPGARGIDVDTAGRTALTSRGYEEYPHGTGHPIGMKVHDVGPKLCPDWPERYGEPVFFKIEPDMVFAIEPLIYIKPPEAGYDLNIALEEDVVVDASGAHYIGTPQSEIILIGGK